MLSIVIFTDAMAAILKCYLLLSWASFLKPQEMCYWPSGKHSYVIFLMVRRVRIEVKTVLGKIF